MRKHRLGILAALSVTMLGVLLCGYFARLDLDMMWHRLVEADLKTNDIDLGLDRGFCTFRSSVFIRPRAEDPARPLGVEWSPEVELGVSPTLSCFWGFSFYRWTDPQFHGLQLAFPIWCLALPWLLAPGLWLRRYRRSVRRGFSVEMSANTPPLAGNAKKTGIMSVERQK